MHCPLTLVISLGQLMAGVCWLFSLFWELCRFLLFEGEERRVQGETRRFRQILHLETAAVEPGGRKVLQSIVVVFWLSAEKDHSHQDHNHHAGNIQWPAESAALLPRLHRLLGLQAPLQVSLHSERTQGSGFSHSERTLGVRLLTQ